MDARARTFARMQDSDAEAAARRFGELFPAVYLRFHRRDAKRRSLVWLTDAGLKELERDREVLSRDLLTDAMARMTSTERRALLRGMSALLRAHENHPNPRKKS
jgi:hypothetical protein